MRPLANSPKTTDFCSTGGKKKKKKGDKESDSRSETPAEEPQASGTGSPAPDTQAPDTEEAPAGDSEDVAMPKTVSIRLNGPPSDNWRDRLRQRCDDACDTVLINHNGSRSKMGCNPILRQLYFGQ